MNWTKLTNRDQLNALQDESKTRPVIIFKHSTRCSISQTVLNRLERHWSDLETPDVKPYFLDLLTYRDISNQIAKVFEVEHESPQIILVQNGKAVYHTSHFEIDYRAVKEALAPSGDLKIK
jgi:bacillithiol system protein YtxJ